MAEGAGVGVFCARITVGIEANTIAKMRVRGMKRLLRGSLLPLNSDVVPSLDLPKNIT